MFNQHPVQVYLGIALLALGLNVSGCAAMDQAMPYVHAGEAVGDFLCRSLDAVKASRILEARRHASEIEIAMAVAHDAESLLKLTEELQKANKELQDALKDAESSSK